MSELTNSKIESYKNNIKLCNRLISKSLDETNLKRNYYIRASNLYKLKDYESAVEDLNAILTIDNEFTHAHYLLGQCLEALGRNADAIDSLDFVLTLNPKHLNARLAKASLLNKLGYLNQSVAEYEQALELEVSDELAQLNDTNYFDYYKSDISSSRSVSNNNMLSYPRSDEKDRANRHSFNELKGSHFRKPNILNIEKMIISPGGRNDDHHSNIDVISKPMDNLDSRGGKKDTTINLRMSDIDSYPMSTVSTSADVKIKDIIKIKREKSREKQRDTNINPVNMVDFKMNQISLEERNGNSLHPYVLNEANDFNINKIKLNLFDDDKHAIGNNNYNNNNENLVKPNSLKNKISVKLNDLKSEPNDVINTGRSTDSNLINQYSKHQVYDNQQVYDKVYDQQYYDRGYENPPSDISKKLYDNVPSDISRENSSNINTKYYQDRLDSNSLGSMFSKVDYFSTTKTEKNKYFSNQTDHENVKYFNKDYEQPAQNNNSNKENIESVSNLLQEAYNLRKLNKFNESLNIYNKALMYFPENYKIFFNRAYTYDKLGELNKSKEDYIHSLKLNSSNSYTYFNLANVCLKLNLYEEAYNYAIQSEKIQSSSNTLILISSIYKKMGRYAESIETLKQLLSKDPKNTNAIVQLAGIYDLSKQFHKSVEVLSELIELKLDNNNARVKYDSYYKRALSYEKIYDNSLDVRNLYYAEADITMCIDQDQKNSDYYNLRGLIFYKQKRYDLSMYDFNSAINLNSNNFVYYYNRSCCYRAQDQFPESYSDIDSAIKLSPKNYNLYLNKAFLSRKVGKVQESIDLLDVYISNTKEGDNIKGYLNRAFCHAKQNDIHKAIEDYSKVISLDPRKTDAYHNRGILWYRLNNFKEALLDFNRIIELDDSNPNCYFYRGSCLESLGREEEAMRDFQIALQLDDNNLNNKEDLL